MSAQDHHRDGRHHDHHHGQGDAHDRQALINFVISMLRPHSHDHAHVVDDTLTESRAGTRALAISLIGLLLTALIQAAVFALSGSVGLLADTIHNLADAFTALPIGLAFVVGRRAPTRRYTYGYGRAEDLAGLAVVVVIAASAVAVAWQSINRLIHPRPISDLGWVAVAGVVGFAGNELAARYRIRVGRDIGSAALVADGYHARTDGFTSLAVVAGAIGVALGVPRADPIVGLAIAVAILVVLRGAGRDVFRRLMDAVNPELIDQVERQAGAVHGVQRVDQVRVRWVGHELRAEMNVTVGRHLQLFEAHEVAETVRHALLHNVRRLTDATIHTDPDTGDGPDPHEVTAHHYNR
jgi:cation diffusion facilitator family transporter